MLARTEATGKEFMFDATSQYQTRRTWKPNAQKCTLFSDILNRKVQLRVTTAALRNIDKAGSLDNYIMHTADKDLQSDVAMDLKIEMLEKMLRQQGMAAQAMQGLGLPPAAQAVLESETQPPSS